MLLVLSGIFFGFITVGAYTLQTVTVLDGKPVGALASSISVSIVYWISISYIVNENIIWYLGFSIGATAANVLLSLIRRNKRNNFQNNSIDVDAIHSEE